MPTTRRCCRPPTRRVSPCSGSRSGRATARASRSPSWCPRRPTSGRSSSSTCGERWSTCGERWSTCGERSSTCVSEPSEELSYRALLSVPSYPRAVAGAQLARIAGQMGAVAMVLFVLTRYHSAALAGIVVFLSIFPGTLFSPFAGALLDRHGRRRLIILDFALAFVTLVLIGVLSLLHLLPVPLLLGLTVVSSITAPLSNVGLRTLYPILVPRRLWERMNAVDSNGYVVASIIGPPLAGVIVGVAGGEAAIITTGVIIGLGALVMIGINDPETNTSSTGNLLRDAWDGLRYVLRNPTLRGLAASISIANLANGAVYIALPVLIFQRFHQGPPVVG